MSVEQLNKIIIYRNWKKGTWILLVIQKSILKFYLSYSSINERDAEIHKLTTDLEEIREDNRQLLLEFNTFKENFYQLEIDYSKNLTLQQEENEKLKDALKTQEAMENQRIQELSLNCEEVQEKLQITLKDLEALNNKHKETLQNFEELQTKFDKQHNEFERFKKQIKEEKEMEQEKNKVILKIFF